MTEQTAPSAESAEAAALSAMESKLFGPAEEEEAQPSEPQEVESPEAAADEEQQPDLEEIEVDDGEKYQVPKKLKDAFLRQQDYTRKTQEVAEMRRNVALQQEAMQAQEVFQKHVAPKRAELEQVQSELKQFKSIDATQLDAEQLMRLQMRITTLRDRAAEIEAGIKSDADQFVQWHQQHRSQLTQQGEQYLKTVIPSWGTEAKQAAATVARDVGYTDAEIAQAFDPRFVRLAYEAAQYRKLMSTKGQAVATAQKAPPVIKPGSSDPAMQQRMQNLNWSKQMKNAKTDSDKRVLAEQRMAKFFR